MSKHIYIYSTILIDNVIYLYIKNKILCVCPTLDKGSFTTTLSTLHRQGRVALPPYHTQRSCGREWEAGPDQPCVPAELLTTLSNWLCLIPWFFMLSPPNLLVPSSCAADLFAAAFVTTMLNLSSARTYAPFCSLTFLPNVTCVN